MSKKEQTSENHKKGNSPLGIVVGSAFSEKQKLSLLYTIRQIIDHTKRTILIENSDLSDADIIKMIEDDFFGE
jgi:hypothetical protein